MPNRTPTHVPEAAQLAAAISHAQGAEATGLATLLQLTESLLLQFGDAKGHDMGPLIALQRDCVRAWMAEKDFEEERLQDALDGMRQAVKTVRYLAAIPA